MNQIILGPIMLFLLANFAFAEGRQEFSYGPDPLQQLDVYPTTGAGNAPIIVMLHGGAWRNGDKRNNNVWRNKAAHWTQQGYIFISINTRLIPDAYPIDQTRDLAAAMAFIQQNARRVGGDPDQIILIGHSAGAHVAGLLATRDDLQRAAGVQAWQGTIILDTAALDLETVMQNQPSRLYQQAFGTGADYWSAASPINHISGQDRPFLVVCSSQRSTPCPAAQAFGQMASANGVPVTILPLALSHSQINARLGLANNYTAAVDDWIDTVIK